MKTVAGFCFFTFLGCVLLVAALAGQSTGTPATSSITATGDAGSQVHPSRIPLTAPMALLYHSTPEETGTDLIFRVDEVAPDLRMEWEQGFRVGSICIVAATRTKSRSFLRSYKLENGRNVELRNETLLTLSRALFIELKTSGKTKLKINGMETQLEKQEELLFDVGAQKIPAITASDGFGNRYCFQDDPDFPLLLECSNRYTSQRLIRWDSSPSIIFRWIRQGKKPKATLPPETNPKQ